MSSTPAGGGVALVTGSGGGLGRACCGALAATGAYVVAADIDLGGAESIAGELRDAGGSASAIGLDVRNARAVDMFERGWKCLFPKMPLPRWMV